MPVDLKSEFARPLALILSALAVLGWTLFVLSSWSSASTQKTQRLRIADLTAKTERLSTDLARQVETSGSLADLQTRIGATQDDLARLSQTRSDLQTDLATAQRSLSTVKRDLTDADRTLQTQSQKLSDIQSTADTTSQAEPRQPQARRSSRRGRWSRRGRSSRSFSIMSRSR